jgi:hypothetical protein
MGLIDKKKNVFTTVGAYSSMAKESKVPDSTNLFPSINNKKDVVPYLLDILKVVAGSFAVQEMVGHLFTSFIDEAEPMLKDGVKKQTVQYNSGDDIPNNFKEGYSIPVSQIDTYGKLKTNPDSTSGQMLYDKNKPNFDSSAYQAIKNSGTDTPFGNLLINYDSNNDNFIFKPNISTSTTPDIGGWMNDFVDEITIIDKKEFMSNVMDAFYGSITNNQGKTVEQIAEELEIDKLLEQLMNDDNSFEISPEDYEAILLKAQELANGVINYDLGCGIMGASLPLSGMSDLIGSISGSTNPFFISNEIGKTIDDTANNKDVNDNNKETIKDNFFQRIIKLITINLGKAVCTAPQIRTILSIASGFQNNGSIKIESVKDSLKGYKVYLKCLIKLAMELINKFIYEFILPFILALISPIIKKITKEKINQFTGIMKSLIASKTPNTQ